MRQGLSGIQTASLLALAALPAAVCLMPVAALSDAGRAAWLSALIAGAGGFVVGFLSLRIASRNRCATFFAATAGTLGPTLAAVLQIALIGYAVLGAALEVRDYCEYLRIFIMGDTPIAVLIAVLVGASAYAWSQGLEVIGRCAPLLLCVSLAIIVAGFVAVAPRMDPGVLMPAGEWGSLRVFDGVMAGAPYIFEVFLLVVVGPYTRGGPFQVRHAALYAATTGVLYALTSVAVQVVYGVEEVRRLSYPMVQMFRLISVRDVLERVDGSLAAAWFNGTFTRTALLGWVACTLIAEILGAGANRSVLTLLVAASITALGVYIAPGFQAFRNLLRPGALPAIILPFQIAVVFTLLMAGYLRDWMARRDG